VKVSGRIAEIFVTEGQIVEKGDILGRLEGKELDAKLKTVNAALKEAEDQYKLAKKTYQRIKTLYKDGVVPKQQFDEIEYKYNASLQKINAVQGQKNEIMAYYDELTITAPIDGEITQIISHPGELVATGYPIITMLDINDMWVVLNIREDILNNLQKDKEIKVYIPALRKSFNMKITYVAAMASFATWKPTNQQNNYDLKTFEVRAKSEENIENLRPGMTAVVENDN
jgi:HlyD family secretion protein